MDRRRTIRTTSIAVSQVSIALRQWLHRTISRLAHLQQRENNVLLAGLSSEMQWCLSNPAPGNDQSINQSASQSTHRVSDQSIH